MTTNELKLAQAFRATGMEQDKAETISQTIFDAIRENVATKSDIAVLRGDLERQIDRVVVRLGGLVVVVAGLLFGALHVWPPK